MPVLCLWLVSPYQALPSISMYRWNSGNSHSIPSNSCQGTEQTQNAIYTYKRYINTWLYKLYIINMPGVGFMVRVMGLGSSGPEFKSCLGIELIPGGVDSACHPSEVGKTSMSLLWWLSHLSILHWSGDLSRIVPNSPGNCFGSNDALYRV